VGRAENACATLALRHKTAKYSPKGRAGRLSVRLCALLQNQMIRSLFLLNDPAGFSEGIGQISLL
jgi:hypothetical protein